MRRLSKNVKKDPHEYVYQGSKKNENKGQEEINMRSLSKNVKKDPQENVYQGSKKMKIRDRRI